MFSRFGFALAGSIILTQAANNPKFFERRVATTILQVSLGEVGEYSRVPCFTIESRLFSNFHFSRPREMPIVFQPNGGTTCRLRLD
jgi:hypothetical protein